MEQSVADSYGRSPSETSNLSVTSAKYGSQLSVEFSDSSYSSCGSDDDLFSSCFHDARMKEILSSSSSNLASFAQSRESKSSTEDVSQDSDSFQTHQNVVVKVSQYNTLDDAGEDATRKEEATELHDQVISNIKNDDKEETVVVVDEECVQCEPSTDLDNKLTFHQSNGKDEGEKEKTTPEPDEGTDESGDALVQDEEIIEPLAVEQDEASFATFHFQMGEKLEDKTHSPQFSPVKRTNSRGKDKKAQGVKGGLAMALNRLSLTFEDYDIIDSKEVKRAEQEERRRVSVSDMSSFEDGKAKNSFTLSKLLPWNKDDKRKIQNGDYVDDEVGSSGLALTSFKNGLDLHYSVKMSKEGETVEEIKMVPAAAQGTSKTFDNKLDLDIPLRKRDAVTKRRTSPVFYDVLGTPELDDLGIAVQSPPKTLRRPRSPRSLKKAIHGGSLRGSKKFMNAAAYAENHKRKPVPVRGEIVMTGFVKTSEVQRNNGGPSSRDKSPDGSADSDFDHVDADMALLQQSSKGDIPSEHEAGSVKVKVRPPIPMKKPVPPPRRKKIRSMYVHADVPDLSNDEKRRASVGSPPKDSKPDENIFKGLIPFFEDDPNRRGSLIPMEKSILLPGTNPDRLILMTDSFPTSINDFPEDRRSLIALEMYTTERSFVRGLETIVQLFKRKLIQAGHLDTKECEIVFSNVEEILAFSKDILISLWKRICNWTDDQTISEIFNDNLDGFKMFATYCQNYDAAEAHVKQKLKKKKDMENLLNTCYSNPVCQPGLTLPSYLITVVQRIPRYILLLKDLSKRTPENHPDHGGLISAVASMEKVATYINEQLKQSQSQKALEALQSQIIGLKDYYISGRSLVYENTVCLMTIKRTYQCVLFNDLMVFATKSGGRQSEVELVLDLSTVWFEDLEDLDPQTTKQDAIALYVPDRPYTLYVGTRGEKKLWLQHLKKAITKHVFGNDASADKDLASRNTSYRYKIGAVYSGEFLNGKRHGEGTMMWPNQMTYRGKWCDDERNGLGILEYGTGEVYEGQWMDDNQHGKGKLIYSSMDVFIGEWTRGIRHGKCRIQFQNGDVFVGAFANDRIEGEGKLICKNGMIYEGNWSKNMKQGKGYLKDIEGNEYRGDFKDDKFNGQGEMMYTSGAVYSGSWEQGKRQGRGTYKVMGGIVYEGQWMDDIMEGHGTLTYSNGDIYEGTWIQGKRFGAGSMRYNDGHYYNGQWEDDFPNGEGSMDYSDGGKYSGGWKYGRRHGHGWMKSKISSIYDGEWRDDLYNGKGRLEKPSGWVYEGSWIDGKRSGYGVLLDPLNNYKYEGEWSNDFREGKGMEMMFGYVYEGEFKNDKRDGRGLQSAPDSTIYEGCWKKGQKHDKGIKRLPNGMRQNQLWQMGCLLETPAMVSRGLPQLERF